MILVIHQRKSAGTSLIHTLQKLTQYQLLNSAGKTEKLIFQKKYFDDSYRLKNIIVSDHLYPTDKNIKWVKNHLLTQKVILLIRNPADSHQAKLRHCDLDNKPMKQDPKKQLSLSYFQEFHDLWLKELKNEPNVIIVRYEQLVTNSDQILREIMTFFDFDLSEHTEELQLLKMRYTGVGLKNLTQNVPKQIGTST